jgi:hypothetical protein
MDRDIHRRNVERLERILKAAADESERKFILKLIEDDLLPVCWTDLCWKIPV